MVTHTIEEQLEAFLVVVASSIAGGFFIGLIFGVNLPKWGIFPGFRWKPLVSLFALPPLILMIIMGCVSRNLFGEMMDAFPKEWSMWIRSVSLCILLIRGGLQVQFKGKGWLVVFMSTIPSWCEAITIAFIVRNLFEMPYDLCFAIAFLIACISPSIMVPGLISLVEQGYGINKGICSSLVSAGTFDDIIAIIIFVILKNVSYEQNGMESDRSFGLTIGLLFIE